jgi:hypothetical protein
MGQGENASIAMAVSPDWAALLAATAEPQPVHAKRHLRGPIASSFSRPHVYLGEDDEEYVVKFRRPDQLRAVASDQVVGRAGRLIGAAVGHVVAIHIDMDLLPSGEDESAADVSHGCIVVPQHVDGGIAHVEANRERLASLAVLYTWTRASNHQLIYQQNGAVPVVYSVDHGHFLPPDSQWHAAALDAEADPASLDPWFTSQGISRADCIEAANRLGQVTPQQVVEAVRSARAEWEITDEDRLALCRYLWRRREKTLELVGGE